MIDPSLKEEIASEGTMTLITNIHKEVCCVQKAGGVAVSVAQVRFFDRGDDVLCPRPVL